MCQEALQVRKKNSNKKMTIFKHNAFFLSCATGFKNGN